VRTPSPQRESDIQEEIVAWLSAISRRYHIGFHSIPNESILISGRTGGKRQYALLAKLKRMGLTPGVADLALFHRGRLYYAEVKRPGQLPSQAQREFQAWCDFCGVPYRVVYSLRDVRSYVRDILSQDA